MSMPSAPAPWLPDLCRLTRLATMLGVAELVVLLIALAPDGGADWTASRFVSASGFALWLALTVTVLLCLARPRLSRLPRTLGGAFALLLAAGVAAAGAALVFVVDANLQVRMVPADVSMRGFAAGSAAITLVVVASVLPYLYAIDAWRAQVRASARAEADALQARIRPHFLFNSMNTIASLTRSDPARAEEAVQDLADLFRANLSEKRAQITLADELEVAGIYERIEKLRLGERLAVDWRTAALPRDAMVPSLLIQPLLENAIYHGIEPRRGGGTVVVQGEFAHDLITLVVRNPMPEGAVVRDGNRLALANIRERLQLMYDERATIKAGRFDDEYIVTLRFPYLKSPGATAAA